MRPERAPQHQEAAAGAGRLFARTRLAGPASGRTPALGRCRLAGATGASLRASLLAALAPLRVLAVRGSGLGGAASTLRKVCGRALLARLAEATRREGLLEWAGHLLGQEPKTGPDLLCSKAARALLEESNDCLDDPADVVGRAASEPAALAEGCAERRRKRQQGALAQRASSKLRARTVRAARLAGWSPRGARRARRRGWPRARRRRRRWPDH